MALQTGLPAALKARGLTVETVPGWETRSAGSFAPKGAICHWTAGPANSTTRPSLNIVVNGRPDLDGPLCNVYLDRNGVAVVVAAGRANHAGAGNWRGLTANSQLFGTECEAAGPADFTDAQRWAYPRVNAAYCDLGKFGADMVAGHSEYALPAGRKTDVNNYPMSAMRAQIAALLAGEEDDMTPDQAAKLDRLALIAERLLVEDMGDYDPKTGRSTEKGWLVSDNTNRMLKRTDIIRDLHHEVRSPFNGQTMVGRLMEMESKVDAIAEALSRLSTGGTVSAASVGIDYAALAKAVNDDAASRLAS